MPPDIGQVAIATVTTIAPFVPFLVDIGKASGKKFLEVIAEKGGEKAWEKAKTVWGSLKSKLGHDKEVQAVVDLVAINPEDQARQAMLADVLIARLKEDPKLAEELFNLLGKQEAIQRVIADHSSWVENVTQQLSGDGKQIVEARNDSVISGVKQIRK
jgi:hypothetical protein